MPASAMSERSRQVWHQIGLAGQVAPDDPYLMTRTLAAQGAGRVDHRFCATPAAAAICAHNSPTAKRLIQFAGLRQLQQHQRVTHALFNDKVAGGGHSGQIEPSAPGPGGQPMIVIQGSDRRPERLLGASDKRQRMAAVRQAKGGSWLILDRRVSGLHVVNFHIPLPEGLSNKS